EVLERLAAALELDAAGREMLFLLGRPRLPPPNRNPLSAVTPALQPVVDALPTRPAYIMTPAWGVVAWDAATAAVLTGWGVLAERDRNLLRRIFHDAANRVVVPEWEEHARFAVAAFRSDVARGRPETLAVAAELQATSADFRRLWAENDVRQLGAGVKQLRHPI